ncbi:MAG TPA: excinuclease ABC subunit UvrC [Polyangiaceae bacterium]
MPSPMPGAKAAAPDFEPKLAQLPAQPGCYVFRDAAGEALYVGKAKSLRSRVRSYFQDAGSDTRAFIPFLRKEVADFETIVTATEKEAAILENSLIKERKPRYNVKLRDDKEYLSVRLSTDHAWPRLELVRRPKPDGARYFGPYHSATAARRTLHLVERHWKLRTCSDRELAGRKRPCLKYQIKRCDAPCVYEVDRELYAEQVRSVGLFLEGRHDELGAALEERMRAASSALEFELAATYRDQLQAVRLVREAQRVVSVSDCDQDVLGMYRQGDLVELVLLVVRSGRVVDTATFSNRRVEIPDDEVVASFLREHYGEGRSGEAHIPDEVIVPCLPEGAEGVAEWLSERRAGLTPEGQRRPGAVHVVPAQRGVRRKLLDLANENARHAFEEKRRAETDIDERLARVQDKLRLPTLPRRIECVDISHLGGEDTVGAVVALENGKADKKRYRTYRVKTTGGGDDYGALREVLDRRFRRGRDARDPTPDELNAESVSTDVATGSEPTPSGEGTDWQLPDLFVVDGGRGQLGVALAAAHDLGLHDLAIVGLAKERESVLGEKFVDRVYLPGQKNPIPLRPNSPELFLLAMARDEAHRFSNRGRKSVGKRRRFESELAHVPGIGPKTRKSLLTTLGSVAALRTATDEQILAVPGVTSRHLVALRSWLSSAPPPVDSAPELPPDPVDNPDTSPPT